jgi:hypothetical protein
MSKYQALRRFLEGQRADRIPMTFAEIERIIGFKLPKSKIYPAWWSNNPTNNVMTNEWLAAGFKTEQVDIEGHKLVFRREQSAAGSAGFAEETRPMQAYSSVIHPIFGALKDVTWIAPGVDLTEPADPEWADLIEDPDWGKLPE